MKTNKIIDDLVTTEKLYNELLMAVGNKYEGETRHQTALRYIVQAENLSQTGTHARREDPCQTKDLKR